MTHASVFLDELQPLHADAFVWAVVCCRGDVGMAEDALQEAYVKIVMGKAEFGGTSTLKTWWLSVVRFTALEQQRKSSRWQRAVLSLFEHHSVGGMGLSDKKEFDGTGEVSLDVVRLADALRQLPARQAEILHLVFQQENSLTEAATVMEISVGSARQHYDRAKKKLRKLLGSSASAQPLDSIMTQPAVPPAKFNCSVCDIS